MNRDQRTDRILDSLGGLKKAAVPDFFYTRLLGRMQQEAGPVKEKPFLLRPAFITTALFLLLILNIVSLVKPYEQTGNKDNPVQKPAALESFSEAYGMNTVSVYE